MHIFIKRGIQPWCIAASNSSNVSRRLSSVQVDLTG